MKGLPREQRVLMFRAFMIVASVAALITVLSAVAEAQALMTMVLGTVSVLLIIASGVLFIFKRPAEHVYGAAVVGLGVIAGAAVGGFIVWQVIPALF